MIPRLVAVAFFVIPVAVCCNNARADVTLVVSKQFSDKTRRTEKPKNASDKYVQYELAQASGWMAFAQGRAVRTTIYIANGYERIDEDNETTIVDSRSGDTIVLDRSDRTYQKYPKAFRYRSDMGMLAGGPVDVPVQPVNGRSVMAGRSAIHYSANRLQHGSKDSKTNQKVEVWSTPELPKSDALTHVDVYVTSLDRFPNVAGMILRVLVSDATSTLDVRATSLSVKPIPAAYFQVPAGYKQKAVVSSAADALPDEPSTPVSAKKRKPIDDDLGTAIADDRLDAAKDAIAKGADVNAQIDDDNNGSMLMVALNHENLPIVEYLLDHGADPNASDDGELPLVRAIDRDAVDVVTMLLHHGADPNKDGPLVEACAQDLPEIVDLLLSAGADVNQKNARSETPLWAAAGEDSPSVVTLLLDKGAHVNDQDTSVGNTPIIQAASHGRSEIVKVLLTHGADLDLLNGDGKSALDVANDGFHPITLKLLQDATGKK